MESRCDTSVHTHTPYTGQLIEYFVWGGTETQMYRCRETFWTQVPHCIVGGSTGGELCHHFSKACNLNLTWRHFFRRYIIKALWCRARFNFILKSRTPLFILLFHLQVNISRAGLCWEITLSYHPRHLFWPLTCPQSCLKFIQATIIWTAILPTGGYQIMSIFISKVTRVFDRDVVLQWYRRSVDCSYYFFFSWKQ